MRFHLRTRHEAGQVERKSVDEGQVEMTLITLDPGTCIEWSYMMRLVNDISMGYFTHCQLNQN